MFAHVNQAVRASQCATVEGVTAAIFDFGGVMTEPIFRRPRVIDSRLVELAAFFLPDGAADPFDAAGEVLRRLLPLATRAKAG